MNAQEYEFHEFANIYRLLEGADFQAMVASIKTGQRNPITLYEGKILDGRNRYKACIAAGVAPKFRTYQGDDPLGEISALNDIRRHDSDNERAMVGARMANLKIGANQHQKEGPTGVGPSQPAVSVERAVVLSGSTRGMVERAKSVVSKGSAELMEAVDKGVISVSMGSDLSKLPVERQAAVVAQGVEAMKAKAKEIRDYGGEIADAPEAEYVAPPESAKLPKVITDDADRLWLLAKLDLNKILPKDISRERVMREVMAYAKARIDNKK